MKEDFTLEADFFDLGAKTPFNRRSFLKLSGGGILVLFTIGDLFSATQEGRQRGYPSDFNAYLRIGEDGRISCFTGKIEMGQGIVTSLAQMLAEELDVTLESIDMVMGDTDLCPWDMGTFGSMSTRFFGPALRTAGAEAKQVLLELASEKLQTPKNQLTAKDGVISNQSEKVTYAQLAKGQKIERKLDHKAVLKNIRNFKTIGKPVTRTDGFEKVTGKAQYAGDILFPGMLYARILRPPAHGSKLVSFDADDAKKIPGVRVVQDDDLVAVLHKYPDVAEKALAKVKAEFDTPPSKVNDKNIFDHLLKVAPDGNTAAEGGTIEEGEKNTKFLCDETYLDGYVSHAPIEPHTAVAKIDGEKMTVWASTQTPFRAKDSIARAIGFPSEKVRVITPFVGGGFGGKAVNGQDVEAARLAKITGKPVQVAWSRAEEFFYDSFRPAAVVKIKSGISESGDISLWDYKVYFAGQRGSEHFYHIPHHRTVVHGSGWRAAPGTHPFATGAWRAPANNTNTFARESQIEIMAAKAGVDPLEFRLKHLKDERMLKTLKTAAEKFGWTPAKGPSGRGFGIACGIDAGTYVSLMAEVDVDRNSGDVQVKRVVCAQDMGLVINPAGAIIQIEGCITMGLGYALSEEIHFNGGQIHDLNFDTYEIPRFSWLPKIETVLVENNDLAPQGGGEPAIICMGGVVANAIFDATGARLFQQPMTPDRVKAAMQNI